MSWIGGVGCWDSSECFQWVYMGSPTLSFQKCEPWHGQWSCCTGPQRQWVFQTGPSQNSEKLRWKCCTLSDQSCPVGHWLEEKQCKILYKQLPSRSVTRRTQSYVDTNKLCPLSRTLLTMNKRSQWFLGMLCARHSAGSRLLLVPFPRWWEWSLNIAGSGSFIGQNFKIPEMESTEGGCALPKDQSKQHLNQVLLTWMPFSPSSFHPKICRYWAKKLLCAD